MKHLINLDLRLVSLLETSKSDILDFKFNKMTSLIEENNFLNQLSNQFYSVRISKRETN